MSDWENTLIQIKTPHFLHYSHFHILIHYNCKNSFLSVTVVPETQIDKLDVDDGFGLVLNRQEDRLQYLKMGGF